MTILGRMKKIILLCAIPILVLALVFGAYLNWSLRYNAVNSETASGNYRITLEDFGFCTNCIPVTYLSGQIAVRGSVPTSEIVMYVNGTYNGIIWQNPAVRVLYKPCVGTGGATCTLEAEGACEGSSSGTSCTTQYASCYNEQANTSCTATENEGTINLTAFDTGYKGGVPDSLTPVIPGDRYVVTCIATFQNGAQANATVVVST